jgi:hypothetical protein
MKRAAISSLAVFLLNWIPYTTYPQFSHNPVKFHSLGSFTYYPPAAGVVKDFKNINSKATDHFARKYKNAKEVKWSSLKNKCLMVHFFNDGIQTKIFYNKRGGQVAVIRYYTEDKLSNEVRHLVKANYCNYNILLVTEVTTGNQTAYLVKIEDEMCSKTIRVKNGGMEVMEEFVKS